MIEMSGIGTYIQHLMGKGLYDLAVGDEKQIRLYDPYVDIIPFNADIYGPKEQVLFPSQKIKERQIALMHFPHYNVPVSFRGDYAVTVHDLTHIVFPEFMGASAKSKYARFLMSHALRNARHIFTVSEYSKKDILDHFAVSSDHITVTYNAIDDEFYQKDSADYSYLYEKYGIPSSGKKILYVGNLKPHKNLNVLLGAAQLLNDEIYLILTGKTFKNPDFEKKEQDIGLSGRIIRTGFISKAELIDLYNLADLFVFPSLYEGFGIPPLEAMACGTPVIAANNSSIPEVLGDAAILFDAGDPVELAEKIRQVLSDSNLYNSLVAKGLLRSRVFSWSKTVDATRGILGKLL